MDRWILLLLAVAVCGCTGNAAITSITAQTETLREGAFSIAYPYDWNITGELDTSEMGFQKDIYHLHHPRNRACRITIETLSSTASRQTAQAQLGTILANKIRMLRNTFTREGYRGFTMDATTTRLGKETAKKSIITAKKSGVTREMVLYVVGQNEIFYIVSYQWFDNWNATAKTRMLAALNSFTVR